MRAQILGSGSQPYFLLSPGGNLAPQLAQGDPPGWQRGNLGSSSPPQPEPDPTNPSLRIDGRCVVRVSPTLEVLASRVLTPKSFAPALPHDLCTCPTPALILVQQGMETKTQEMSVVGLNGSLALGVFN